MTVESSRRILRERFGVRGLQTPGTTGIAPDAEGKYAGERHLSRFRLVVQRTINRTTGTPPRQVDDPAGLIQSYDAWRPR
jgi:hypothetical protein